MAGSWLKIQGIMNEKQFSIIEDGAYSKTYEKKGADYEEQIKNMKENLEELKLKNKELECKIPVLEIEYQTAMKNLPVYSKMYRRARERLEDLQKENETHKEKLRSNLQSLRTECREVIVEREKFVPGWREYQVEIAELQKLELEDKIIEQAIDDQKEKNALKREIQTKIFNNTIINFAQKIVDIKEHIEVKRGIKEMENTGNKLLKIYGEKLAEKERREKSCNYTDYFDLRSIKLIPLPPVEIKEILPKPSPALSTISVRSNKFSLGEEEKKKIRQKIIENKKILSRLSSNKNLLELSPEKKATPPAAPSKKEAVVADQIFKQPEPAEKIKVLQEVILTPKAISRRLSQCDIPKTPVQYKQQGLKRQASTTQLVTPKKINMGFGNITKPVKQYRSSQEHFSQLLFNKENTENYKVKEPDFYQPQFSKSSQELVQTASQELSSPEISATTFSQEHNAEQGVFKIPYATDNGDLFESNFNEFNTSNGEMSNNVITKNDTFLGGNNSFGPFNSDFTFNLMESEKITLPF